jgi:hypothetical protein
VKNALKLTSEHLQVQKYFLGSLSLAMKGRGGDASVPLVLQLRLHHWPLCKNFTSASKDLAKLELLGEFLPKPA